MHCFRAILLIFILFFSSGKLVNALDVGGAYVGQECQKSDCKSLAMEGVTNALEGMFFGTNQNNVFIVEQIQKDRIKIFWPKKNKYFNRTTLDSTFGFKVKPTKGGGNDELEGYFEDKGYGEIILHVAYRSGSGGSNITYYTAFLSKTDIENKKRLGSQEDIDRIKEEKNKLEQEVSRLKKELKKPLRIDTKNLPNNVTVSEDVNLRSRPSVDSKKITVIKKGAKINNLIELPPSRKWSFVATGDGLIGYMQSAFIVNRPSDGQAPLQPTTVIEGSEAISITLPKWDSGMINKQITLKAAGFVTIKGLTNVSNLDKVVINGKESSLDNNLFGTVLQVKSGNNRVKIEAIESSGKSHKLEFNIKAP